MAKITLSPEVKRQLQVWLTEPGGLNDWLAEPRNLLAPENNVPRTDMNGLTISLEAQAQKELYDFLLANDGLEFDPSLLKPEWRLCAKYIRGTYTRELSYRVEPGGQTITRTKCRDFFDEVVVSGGEASRRPPLE